jgi:hypothetical protein
VVGETETGKVDALRGVMELDGGGRGWYCYMRFSAPLRYRFEAKGHLSWIKAEVEGITT